MAARFDKYTVLWQNMPFEFAASKKAAQKIIDDHNLKGAKIVDTDEYRASLPTPDPHDGL